MFKRRDRRPIYEVAWRVIYPRGGWRRAAGYVRHRLTRLPDSPERVARGIASGVFVSFSPLYGTHFLLAAIVAKLIRGNILAALLGTFFGNPLTFVPIAAMSLSTGQFLLGREAGDLRIGQLGRKFAAAWLDFSYNFKALFTGDVADWTRLSLFLHDIFFPFLLGGLIPGAVSAIICYILTLPIIRAYQKRRLKTRADRISKLLAERDGRQKASSNKDTGAKR